MKILYFAWLRERLNRASDEVSPPDTVSTLEDLVAWLRSQDEALDLAMANPRQFKLSQNARIVPWNTVVSPEDTIAILPPMTGG